MDMKCPMCDGMLKIMISKGEGAEEEKDDMMEEKEDNAKPMMAVMMSKKMKMSK